MDDNLSKKIQNLSTRLKGISDNITSFSQIFDSYADGIITKLGVIDGSIKTMDGNQQAGAELIAEVIYDFSKANGEKMDSLFTVINTQGGELVAAIDGNGELIVGAIGANGTAIKDAITTQGQAIVAEITNLLGVARNINQNLALANQKADITNQTLNNIQVAIVNNAQALNNIYTAIDNVKGKLAEIADAAGASSAYVDDLVEAVGLIATNTGGNGALAQAILTISTKQTLLNTYIKAIAGKIDTTNGSMAEIVDALDALNNIYTAITAADANEQLENLADQLDKIVTKLEQIKGKM